MSQNMSQKAQESIENGGLPVFKSVFRRLLLGSLIMPPIAAILVYGLTKSTHLPTWLIGLVTGSVVALGIAVSVWSRLGVTKRSLNEISHWLDRPLRDNGDSALDTEGDRETTELRRAINRISTSLHLVREENEAMRFLQEVIDALPDPLVVLNENGTVELANQRFATLLSSAASRICESRGTPTTLSRVGWVWREPLRRSPWYAL